MNSLRIVVMGYIVRGPLGGMAWHYLHYALGLRALGHDVMYIEDSDDHQWSCYDPRSGASGTDPTYGLAFAEDAFRGVGLGDRWTYFDAHTAQWFGPAAGSALEYCRTADVLVNVSASNRLRPWMDAVRCRVMIDTDPAFGQIRNLTDPDRARLTAHHNAFFTFGRNIHRGDSSIPNDGYPWRPTCQPVVLANWKPVGPVPTGHFTTVMQWDSYRPREYEGATYGMKSDSFPLVFDLPQRVGEVFEIAVGGVDAPRGRLAAKGWKLADPLAISKDPWRYQRFIQRSKGEFSVAKHGYVISNSGWFSERSAAYLATGRPVILQDTGFTSWLPSGRGVLAFSNEDEAVGAIGSVIEDYEAHCAAAREIAEEYFDARRVLGALLDTVS